MTTVLAAVDSSAAARPVLAVATAFAELLDADVEALHALEDGERSARAAATGAGVALRTTTKPVVAALVEAGGAADVAAVVVGARGAGTGRRPAGHVALELARSLPKPLVVVPPDVTAAGRLGRVLVPLDGHRATSAALAETMALACRRELDVVALHVQDHLSIPPFSDQRQHELEAWSREFLRRHCPYPERVRLEVRTGVPGLHVLSVAEQTGADMIALGWSQDLTPGRAEVVREVLERSPVPVLLVPVAA